MQRKLLSFIPRSLILLDVIRLHRQPNMDYSISTGCTGLSNHIFDSDCVDPPQQKKSHLELLPHKDENGIA